jgi:hypothetical protein
MNKKIVIAIAVVLVVAVAAGWWFFTKDSGGPVIPFVKKTDDGNSSPEASKTPEGGEESPVGLGGGLYESAAQNPAEEMPDMNPFEKNLNPYKSAYTNPFE